MFKLRLLIVSFFLLNISSAFASEEYTQLIQAEGLPAIRIEAKGFADGEAIPVKYTCDGSNESMPLRWKNAPKEAQSFVIVIDDPDAPSGLLIHWVIFNLPPTVDMLPGNLPRWKKLANQEMQAVNGKGEIGYDGPCPKPGTGTHHYRIHIFALDQGLRFRTGGIPMEKVFREMRGHVIARGTLTGTYTSKE